MSARVPRLDQPSVAQDGDLVAERLHLAQDVRRQEHGLTPLLGLVDALPERLLHERVESRRRFVEDEQVRPAHEGGDEEDLLAVPRGVRPDLLVRVQFEVGDQLVSVGLVDPALDPTQEMQRLPAGECRPQVLLAGHIGEVPVRGDRTVLAVQAEDLGPTGRRSDQSQQQSDSGRLTRSVGSEVAEDLAGPYLEGEISEHVHTAVTLGEPLRAYCGEGAHASVRAVERVAPELVEAAARSPSIAA